MPVGVWIVGEGDVILILEIHKRRAIAYGLDRVHAYLAVVIDSHEREVGWIR